MLVARFFEAPRVRIRRHDGSMYKSLLGSGSGTRNRPIARGAGGTCCHHSPILVLPVGDLLRYSPSGHIDSAVT